PVIEDVYCRGRLTAENGTMRPGVARPDPIAVPPSMNIKMEDIDFAIPAAGPKIRVMEIVPDQLITRQHIAQVSVCNGRAVSDPGRDLLKIAVIERHHASGNMGQAFVKGLGLKRGALASSVAHDSHNIIVVGTTDEDMRAALETVVAMGGGLAAVSDHQTLAGLPLPIAGLMSPEPVPTVRDRIDRLVQTAHNLGSPLKDPFMTLSFLALPVIPELKLTDRGLIDVNRFKVVPLFVT
ncbi:MAG: adenine deaminase, partial [Desulfobacterales bacterium]